MKRRLVGSAMLLLASLAGISRAQQEPQPDPLAKLDAQSRRQIEALIDTAEQAGLPWNRLRLKAIEGANKKVDGKTVLAKVREYYKAMVLSKSILGPRASEDDIETGVSALNAKLSVEDLTQFRAAAGGRSPIRPLTYLADLISKRNVPREEAVAGFARLWKDGAADADFDALWRGIDSDILSGVNPRAALQSRLRSIPPRLSKPPADQLQENPRS